MNENEVVKDFDRCKALIDKVFFLAEQQKHYQYIKVSKKYSKILYNKQHLSIVKYFKLIDIYNELRGSLD